MAYQIQWNCLAFPLERNGGGKCLIMWKRNSKIFKMLFIRNWSLFSNAKLLQNLKMPFSPSENYSLIWWTMSANNYFYSLPDNIYLLLTKIVRILKYLSEALLLSSYHQQIIFKRLIWAFNSLGFWTWFFFWLNLFEVSVNGKIWV